MRPISLRRLKYIFYSRFKKEELVWAEAVSNYLGQGYFAFFYDADNMKPRDAYEYVNRVYDAWFANPVKGYLELKLTTHPSGKIGTHIIIHYPMSLNLVKKLFDNFKRDIPSDYEFGIPNWLRVSPKWDREGHVVQEAPITVYKGDKANLTFRHKKLYWTTP